MLYFYIARFYVCILYVMCILELVIITYIFDYIKVHYIHLSLTNYTKHHTYIRQHIYNHNIYMK